MKSSSGPRNGVFYPERGLITVPAGEFREIEELNVVFPGGHRHRYLLYGFNSATPSMILSYYYLIVFTGTDFNRNGRDDVFLVMTYLRNGETVYHRRIVRYN